MKDYIERIKKAQENGCTVCPRCGRMTMKLPIHTNALSRSADCYVCDACGMQEAICNAAMIPDIFDDWSVVKAMKMKEVKVEWCENFIRAAFTKHHPFPGGGIEVSCFWKMAKKSGLWLSGVYNTPMSQALQNLTVLEDVTDETGKRLYSVFKLAK